MEKQASLFTKRNVIAFPFVLAIMAALFFSAASVYADRISEPHENETVQPMALTPLLIKHANGDVVSMQVEIAQDADTWRQGLMYRTEMPNDQGMLFFFPKERRLGMWMKNTYIPLDMLFLDVHGTVVDLHENAVPHSLDIIRSSKPGRAVLEINAGLIAAWGIAVGDQLHHDVFVNLPYEE